MVLKSEHAKGRKLLIARNETRLWKVFPIWKAFSRR
jgi:hypothetical protein